MDHEKVRKVGDRHAEVRVDPDPRELTAGLFQCRARPELTVSGFDLPQPVWQVLRARTRVTRTLGVVRGIVVRSRSIFGTIGAGLQTLVGGNITLLTNLCEKTRQEAFDLMLQHAAEVGANAVVGARYDATEIMQGVTEVFAYGTAVFVEPAK